MNESNANRITLKLVAFGFLALVLISLLAAAAK